MRFIRIGEHTIAIDCIKCVYCNDLDGARPPFHWRIIVKLKDGTVYYPMYGDRDVVVAEYERASAELTRAQKEEEETK